jgi:hypothetical protein
LLRTLHRTFSYDDFTAIVTVPTTTTTPTREATSWLASDTQIDEEEEEDDDDDDDLPKDTPQQQERTFRVRQILRRFPIPLMRGTTHGEDDSASDRTTT